MKIQKSKQSWSERIKRRNRAGFSLVELIVIIAMMAVLVSVLAPTLLSYVERSRAQKDVSAMDEVTNAVFLSMADMDVYDELVSNSLPENVSCYIDTNDEADHEANKVITKKVYNWYDKYTFNDNSRLQDEVKYYAAGNMRGVTITFSPNPSTNESGYVLADGVVNEFLTDGSVKLVDMPHVYNMMRQVMGDEIKLTSQTYRNSDYTIFIKIGSTGGNQASAQDAIEAYGQYSGTNLPVDNVKYYVANNRKVGDPMLGVEPSTPEIPETPEVEDEAKSLAPGLYETGAIALWQAGKFDEASAMLKTSWEELEASGAIVVSEGPKLPENMPEMNEYGFYFGVEYAITIEGATLGMVFYDDGSAVIGTPGESLDIPSGSLIYADHFIDASVLGGAITVSDDGLCVYIEGLCLSLGGGVPPKGTVYLSAVDDSEPQFSGDLVLSNSAVYIQSETFYGQDELTSVLIPNSVVSIGAGAFGYCDQLGSVIIGSGVTSIEERAFYGCKKLAFINIPNGVTTIGKRALGNCGDDLVIFCETAEKPDGWNDDWDVSNCPVFWSCSDGGIYEGFKWACIHNEVHILSYVGAAEEMIVPHEINGVEVTIIGEEAFYECGGLKAIVIPNSVTTISDYAFYHCDNIQSIVIPDSVTTIGTLAFAGCKSLDSITIGEGLASIEYDTFDGCKSLRSIIVDEKNPNYKDIDGNLYSKDGSVLVRYACNKPDTSFTVPDTVRTIKTFALLDSANLTSIIIPASVTCIEGAALRNCNSLESLTIPFVGTSDGATGIDGYFSSIFGGGVRYEDNPKYIPSSLKTVIVLDGATCVGGYAFTHCPKIEFVSIPDSVISFGNNVFWGCTNLTSVTFGENSQLTNIGDKAFWGCDRLESIEIPDSVTAIGTWAFAGCDNLTSVVFNGTTAQWLNVEKGSNWNSSVPATYVQCSDGKVDVSGNIIEE